MNNQMMSDILYHIAYPNGTTPNKNLTTEQMLDLVLIADSLSDVELFKCQHNDYDEYFNKCNSCGATDLLSDVDAE